MRALVGIVLFCLLAAGVASAQNVPLDVGDPSITKRPEIDRERTDLPQYPLAAFESKQEGVATGVMCVDTAGRVSNLEMITLTSSSELNRVTREWMQKLRFKPADANGKTVAVCGYELSYEWKIAPPELSSLPPSMTRYPRLSKAKPDMRPAAPADAAPPIYPPEALPLRAKGKVKMEACVGPDGKVTAVGILESRAGPLLAAAAAKWLLTIRLNPAVKDGVAIGVCGVEFEYDWKAPE